MFNLLRQDCLRQNMISGKISGKKKSSGNPDKDPENIGETLHDSAEWNPYTVYY